MKIKLFDGTEFAIKDGAALSNIQIPVTTKQTKEAIVSAITTKGNLATVDFIEDNGGVSGHYEDMIMAGQSYTVMLPEEDETDAEEIIVLSIREKTVVEKRLDSLEEGQSIQDGALADLGAVVSEMMEV